MSMAFDSEALRGALRRQEPMARHSSWKAGGPADYYYKPVDGADLAEFIRRAPSAMPLTWVGHGSNLLVRDGGLRGAVITVAGALTECARPEANMLKVGAGLACPRVARFAAEQGLAGLEFLAGIPGTVGGALAMNAGAYCGEIWDFVTEVETIDRRGERRTRARRDFSVAYRRSGVPPGQWFVAATFKLKTASRAAVEAMIAELMRRRDASQPWRARSCGSVFKNPPGDHAARLIEDCGLKGRAIGDAQVSEQHANFILNKAHATAREIEQLIELVRAAVMARHGVWLELEVRIIGDPAAADEGRINQIQTNQPRAHKARPDRADRAAGADRQAEYRAVDFGRVAVLMGGRSAEREISLASGRAVLAALLEAGVEAEAVDVDRATLRRLLAGEFARAFIALHGRGGEDGAIQGALEAAGLPYTGSGVSASALAMDKLLSKALWRAGGLPTPAALELTEASETRAVAAELGLPLMVKPVQEGSSFGAARVATQDELAPARRRAARFGRVMAEAWIEGAEYTVPVLNERALPIIKLETGREFYDYQAKYEAGDTQYICPCGLDAKAEARLGELSLRACRALGVSGWARVDLLLDHADRPWLIEVNTVPGMTGHSLVPMAAREAGISFQELTLQILATSLAAPGQMEAGD